MGKRLRSFKDRMHSSFIFVPTVFVVGAIGLGELMLMLDARIEHVPSHLTATVDSARNVLTVVAGATLAFAGIAFSVSLLLISLSSSQYSPRVVHGLFRDPFNKRIMGIVVGTFTYSLVVLRAVRGPLEMAGPPTVPSVSILLGVALGIVCVLAIVAFINHSAHSMDVSKILHRVTDKALDQIRGASGEETGPADQCDTAAPDEVGFTVTADAHGWVLDIDLAELLAIAEPGGCTQLKTIAGRYAIQGTPLCTIWPTPSDVRKGKDEGMPVYYGGATSEEALRHAHVDRARMVVLLMNDPQAAQRVVDTVKRVAPGVSVLMRTRYLAEREGLLKLGAKDVVAEEVEGAVEIISRMLRGIDVPRNVIDDRIRGVRGDTQTSERKQTVPRKRLGDVGALSEMKIECALVHEHSPAAGASPVTLRLRSETGALVVGVHRDDKLLEKPDPTVSFQPGDIVYFVGTNDAVTRAVALFEPERSQDKGDAA